MNTLHRILRASVVSLAFLLGIASGVLLTLVWVLSAFMGGQ